VLALKRDEVGTLKTRLRVGLDKLIATAEQVEDLQVKLTAMEPSSSRRRARSRR
jgi:dynein heavy chain